MSSEDYHHHVIIPYTPSPYLLEIVHEYVALLLHSLSSILKYSNFAGMIFSGTERTRNRVDVVIRKLCATNLK